MATEFKLPELGENVYEGTVVRLLVKVGDTVAKDQNVLEIETGKATVELPTPVGGKVLSIAVKEGDKAKVGQTVMTFDGAAAAAATAPKEEAPKAAAPVAAAPVVAPAPAPAPVAKPVVPTPAPAAQPIVVAQSVGSVPASPSTRQFAREIGIDVTLVPGTGPGGRVSTDDVKAFSRASQAGLVRGAAAKPAVPSLPDFARWGETEREPMNNIRIATSDHMSLAWTTIPHVTIHDSADITELEKLRGQYRAKAEASGAKLTLTAFILKIVASALKNHPKINASLDIPNHQIVLKKFVNVGVAVDTDRGLVVPVIRDADKKNVLQIAQELNRIGERAKARKISPDEMQGGTFTVTNIGPIGGKYFTPIVNWPEVAILGIGRGTVEPVNIGGFFHPRQMLPLSLSFDHRLVDGADGARFLRWIIDAIHQPSMISVEG